MKRSVKLTFTVLCAAMFLCSAGAGVLYFLSARSAFDTSILHFNDAPAVTGMVVCYVAAAVLCAAAGLVLRRKASVVGRGPENVLTSGTSLICALMFAVCAALRFMDMGSRIFAQGNALNFFSALFAALSALYFILFYGGNKLIPLRGWLSFAPVLWATFDLLLTYFDDQRTINDPVKSLSLLLMSALLLFLCEEIRFYVGIQNVSIYVFTALGAAFVTVSVAIPNLILSMMKVPTFEFDVAECVLLIAVGFFALARLASLPKALGEYVKPVHPNDKKATAKAESDEAEAEAEADEAKSDVEASETEAEANEAESEADVNDGGDGEKTEEGAADVNGTDEDASPSEKEND